MPGVGEVLCTLIPLPVILSSRPFSLSAFSGRHRYSVAVPGYFVGARAAHPPPLAQEQTKSDTSAALPCPIWSASAFVGALERRPPPTPPGRPPFIVCCFANGREKKATLSGSPPSSEILFDIVLFGVSVRVIPYLMLASPFLNQPIQKPPFVLNELEYLGRLFVASERHHLRCAVPVLRALLALLLCSFFHSLIFNVQISFNEGGVTPSQVN